MKSISADENLARGHRKRIKERFMKYGSDMLAEYEKLELFLTLCIPQRDVKPIAKNLIKTFGSINAVLNASDKELMLINGIGESVLCNIKILRMCLEAHLAESIKEAPLSLDSVELLSKYFERRLAPLEYEVLEMICLDAQLNLIGNSAIRIFEGSISSVQIDVRKIIEIAFKKSAVSIVLAHNHPSGDIKASDADIEFTKTLASTCKLLKLDFIEHIIVAKNQFYSFRRNGHLDMLYDTSLSKDKRSKISTPRKSLKI